MWKQPHPAYRFTLSRTRFHPAASARPRLQNANTVCRPLHLPSLQPSGKIRFAPGVILMNSHSGPANPLFTIGHSNLEIADFLGVLAAHGVRTVCDVRSRPASFRFPQFNRESLESGLAPAGIRYEFFGERLGCRPLDTRIYRERGVRDYAAIEGGTDFAGDI